MLLGFNAVSNLYANVNNNDNNNNNNNNDNDFGSVSGNANDVAVQNNYMSTVITIVPPVGPPVVVPVGRAVKDKGIFLDSRFKKSDVYFEDGASKIFPNGTIIYDDGSQIEASVFFGAIDPNNPQSIISLKAVLGDQVESEEEMSLELLQKLDDKRRRSLASSNKLL